jgi:hypothetical protein
MRWPGVAHVVVKRKAYRVLVRNHVGRRPLENLGIDGRVIFKWIIKRGWEWTGFLWLWMRTGDELL